MNLGPVNGRGNRTRWSQGWRVLSFHTIALTASCTSSTGVGLEAVAYKSGQSPALAVDKVQFQGRRALRLIEQGGPGPCCLLSIPGSQLQDGIIEAWVFGRPKEGARETARGFIGLAFRIESPTQYDAIYIRPANARADDQLRRNHTIQYISHPDYPWERLRKETPGVFESHADFDPEGWTQLRIEVTGERARLFIGASKQPALIVNRLKRGSEKPLPVGLWVGSETEGYFSGVRVLPATPEPEADGNSGS